MSDDKTEVQVNVKDWRGYFSIFGFCMVIFIGGFITGVFSAVAQLPMHQDVLNDNNFSLTGADKNWIVGLEIQAGTCERMGFVTKIFVQTDGNIQYGIPVCVPADNNVNS